MNWLAMDTVGEGRENGSSLIELKAIDIATLHYD